jgi:hypothetical protein
MLFDPVQADGIISAFQRHFFHQVPVVLIAQDSEDGPIFYGRADMVRVLENVDVDQIPWVNFTLTSAALR